MSTTTPTSPFRALWLSQQRGRKAVLYLIRLTGNGEPPFYKVGVTYCFSARFGKLRTPYQVRTIARYSSHNAARVWDLEQALHARFAAQRYTPGLPFAGAGECYAAEVADLLAALPADSFVLKHVTRNFLEQ